MKTEEITRRVLLNLIKQKIEATPSNYEKEFLKVSNELGYYENKQQNLFNDKNNFINTLHEALKPSVSLWLDSDLDNFIFYLLDNPDLLMEQSSLDRIDYFIQKRFNTDASIVSEKTADITKLVLVINDILSSAVQTSSEGKNCVKQIKEKISCIDVSSSTKEELNILQSSLIEAASNLEEQMDSVGHSFKESQNDVQRLKDRINELEDELKRAHQKSEKDFLTQVVNRRAFENRFDQFEQKYNRLGQKYAVVFFDLDKFKSINDKYGHNGGDVVLKTFASILQKLTREVDIVARYGGEEFVSVIHYKDINEIFIYIKRIKDVVSKHKFIYQEHKIELTFSAGIQLRENCQNAYETISDADDFLYVAKSSGRNKIVLWNKEEL
ncbi:MAG: diguanylate cyclase [Campylobacterales bacterium]|nr:diguanylate cyclase [Campylobacterales bacterium]